MEVQQRQFYQLSHAALVALRQVRLENERSSWESVAEKVLDFLDRAKIGALLHLKAGALTSSEKWALVSMPLDVRMLPETDPQGSWAYLHVRLAFDLAPRIPPAMVSWTPSARGYTDITPPQSALDTVERLEMLQRTAWRLAIQRAVYQESVRKLYALFEAGYLFTVRTHHKGSLDVSN